MTALIQLDDVSVNFPLNFEKAYTARARFARVLNQLRRGQPFIAEKQLFHALKSVTMEANAGDVIGVIGANGSGKTTLLRAIAGIYEPDTGRVVTEGRLSTLLSLGTGFNNALSGRRNVYMVGYLMGLSTSEIDARFDDIVAYAELNEFIDVPVKYYSNGMISRLGFAIATSIEPEIILIDEIFSVGDLAFKAKSEKTIQSLLAQARCQVIVTHSLNFVRENCSRALYLRDGSLVADGEPSSVVDEYEGYVRMNPRTRPPTRVYKPSG